MHNMAAVVSPLQQREVFHLAFLRGLARTIPPSSFSLKGGANIRFFYGSIRYSEDMDLDIVTVPVHTLREKVMGILDSSGLSDTLRLYGISRIRPPNLAHAKQTETVQRFKVHLLTTAGTDLPTKIEFSRSGLDTPVKSEPVSPIVLGAYRMAPLIVPHYTADAAARQKITALAQRAIPAARDVFDLHILGTQPEVQRMDLGITLPAAVLHRAKERILELDYDVYRDTVLDFLLLEDRAAYASREVWDRIRLEIVNLLERIRDED